MQVNSCSVLLFCANSTLPTRSVGGTDGGPQTGVPDPGTVVDTTLEEGSDGRVQPTPRHSYTGNDRELFGIVLAVLTFWLFAQTTLNLIPDMQRSLTIDAAVLNLAVSVTSLVTGIFIAVAGGLADRLGRIRFMQIGLVLSVAGSACIVLTAVVPPGANTPLMLLGRVLQGFSAAAILSVEPRGHQSPLPRPEPPTCAEFLVDRQLRRLGVDRARRRHRRRHPRMAVELRHPDHRVGDRLSAACGRPGDAGRRPRGGNVSTWSGSSPS